MLPDGINIFTGNGNMAISELSEGAMVKVARGWGSVVEEKVEEFKQESTTETCILKLTTSEGKTIRCSAEQQLFARIDKQVKYYSVYLQERSTLGFRLGVSYDLVSEFTSPSVYKAEFEKGITTEIIDKIWIIENTTNLDEAHFIQKFAAYKYGIPDVPFNAKKVEMLNIGDEFTKLLYENINTPENARRLLNDSYMFLESPHIIMRFLDIYPPVSNAINFVIFGGQDKLDNSGYSSLIQVGGLNDKICDSSSKSGKKRKTTFGNWNLEITRDDLDEAELFVKTLSHLDNLDVIKKIQITKKTPYYVLPASHVKRGMIVPIMNNDMSIDEEIICKVDIEDYSGSLYSPKVRAARNLVANGWFIGA